MSQDRKAASERSARLVERAETLLDEAVGQAAKGSYREAADKAQEALAIDPENTAARDLLDSYRRQIVDDDERRRRRRSIAAAAAAIEEMVENDRLDEASSATDALAMQFGVDAPVEDLRRRVAEARAQLIDIDELDAAIESIRVAEGRPTPSRAEPGGAIAAEVEEHLRAGRLDEASRAVSRLEREPDATERAIKLRTRIEEAMHVAAEHRREEEILIATAAIEERIRRGNIDEAAERLDDLERRHGDSAPLAELGQRLAEARALQSQKRSVGAERGDMAEPVTASVVTAPVFGQSMAGEESRGGRTRTILIAVAALIALAAGAWWLTQRGDDASAPTAPQPTATDARSESEGLAPAGSLDAQPPAAESAETGAGTDGIVAPPPARQDVAAAPATGAERRPDRIAPPQATAPREPVGNQAARTSSRVAATPPPAPTALAQNESSQAPAVVEARNASAPETTDAASAQPPTAPEPAEVLVEAIPAAEIPPPPTASEPIASTPAAADAPAAARETAAAPALESESAREPAADTRPAPVAEAPRAAAPPPSPSGPAILGCGDPGVVCVKAVQVPMPRYPAAARARRLSGNVVVMALVNEQGRVVQARVDSPSFAFFNDAALEAARRATFQPATRQGVAGQSWARLTFRFEEP